LPQFKRQLSIDTWAHLPTSLSHLAWQIGPSSKSDGGSAAAAGSALGIVLALAVGAGTIGEALATGAALDAAGTAVGASALGGEPAHAVTANSPKTANPRLLLMTRDLPQF
jgi:hypothetical protein